MDTSETELLELFPNLKSCDWEITSDKSVSYNCIGWAMGQKRNWWPEYYFWPEGALREETVEAGRQAFATFGFEVCDTADLESGFEKVAIYSQGNELTHAARQLPNGHWTSKLGMFEDIRHSTLEGIEGEDYGAVALIMRRPMPPLS